MDSRRTLRQQRDDAIAERDEARKSLQELAETTSTKQFNVSYLTRQLAGLRLAKEGAAR
jgi:hypothetical protein